MTMDRETIGDVTVRVRYDEAGDESGWYAEYTRDGVTVDDSQKVWHPTMPRRRDAERAARRIARSYARGL
jgi:hypothetical protein